MGFDREFPSPIGELHFSILSLLFCSLELIIVSVPYRGATFLNRSRCISAHIERRLFPSPIGELHFSINFQYGERGEQMVSVPYRGATFLNTKTLGDYVFEIRVSVPYRGATFLNKVFYRGKQKICEVSVPYRGATFLNCFFASSPSSRECFRPLSGSYISQYHPRNPMSCLRRIGGLRGKSNFIEMQPFWKVKNSHKSSI